MFYQLIDHETLRKKTSKIIYKNEDKKAQNFTLTTNANHKNKMHDSIQQQIRTITAKRLHLFIWS